MRDIIYYVDEYDWKKARWNLISSCSTKREAISRAKTAIKGFPMRVRKVTTEVIIEVTKE